MTKPERHLRLVSTNSNPENAEVRRVQYSPGGRHDINSPLGRLGLDSLAAPRHAPKQAATISSVHAHLAARATWEKVEETPASREESEKFFGCIYDLISQQGVALNDDVHVLTRGPIFEPLVPGQQVDVFAKSIHGEDGPKLGVTINVLDNEHDHWLSAFISSEENMLGVPGIRTVRTFTCADSQNESENPVYELDTMTHGPATIGEIALAYYYVRILNDHNNPTLPHKTPRHNFPILPIAAERRRDILENMGFPLAPDML